MVCTNRYKKYDRHRKFGSTQVCCSNVNVFASEMEVKIFVFHIHNGFITVDVALKKISNIICVLKFAVYPLIKL